MRPGLALQQPVACVLAQWAQEQVFILWGGATLRWKRIKPQRGFPGDLAFPVWGLSRDAQADYRQRLRAWLTMLQSPQDL